MEKFLLISDEQVIGLKYDFVSGTGVIGGALKFRSLIESVLSEYFLRDVWEKPHIISRSKCRISFTCDRKIFDNGLQLLKDHGVIVKIVNSLERLFR